MDKPIKIKSNRLPFAWTPSYHSSPPLTVDRTKPRLSDLSGLESGILLAVAYADIFDFPLTPEEIHRYLVGEAASLEEVLERLHAPRDLARVLSFSEGFYTLSGREHLVAIRRKRAALAAVLWPRACSYGSLLGRIPFVRMVAITGALAVSNVEEGADLDYLIVTEPGRLWLCRGLVILLVRLAAMRGDILCPNYFLSENALVFPQPSLYAAHEMAQMVPVHGLQTYRRLRHLNPWAFEYLPNAQEPPASPLPYVLPRLKTNPQKIFETILRPSPWDRLERWEMVRKIRKFTSDPVPIGEANFSPDWCKGHFQGHAEQTAHRFSERLEKIESLI